MANATLEGCPLVELEGVQAAHQPERGSGIVAATQHGPRQLLGSDIERDRHAATEYD
jgi:hypothetical protein